MFCLCVRARKSCYIPGLFSGAVPIVEVSRGKRCNKMRMSDESEEKAEKNGH